MTGGEEIRLGSAAIVLAWAIVGVGAGVQGTVGFGLALVAAPVLVLVDPLLVPGPLIFAALFLTLVMAHQDRRSIDLRGFPWVLGGRLVGTFGAALTLVALPERALSLVFGALVLLAVALSGAGLRLRPTLWTLLGAGALSGFMGTTSSIGGPPLALVYQDADSPRLRGTLAGHFVVGSAISLVALAAVGRFGLRELAAGGLLVPGILAGYALSRRPARRLDGRRTRTAVLAVSGAAGVLVILRALG